MNLTAKSAKSSQRTQMKRIVIGILGCMAVAVMAGEWVEILAGAWKGAVPLEMDPPRPSGTPPQEGKQRVFVPSVTPLRTM